MREIPIGLHGRAEAVVTQQTTAAAAGSGTLEVFGTPYMQALMEQAAYESVQPYLEEGQTTVGTKLQVSHDAASPVGITVWAESELVEAEGKRLVFTVTACDTAGSIGRGFHERVIISNDRFLSRCYGKLEKK